MRPVRLWLAALAAAFAGTGLPASADVGVASVVQGEPKGKPPSLGERVLKIGNDLQADERVTTAANDRAHIVFLDGTSLTVGPNSVVVLDKFVFDPNRGVGEMSLSTLKGSMRFVGGLVSKTSTVTVKAPTSTLGIRGGIAIVDVSPSGVTTAALLFGVSLTVTSQGVTQTATPNFQITVEPGKPPSPPVPIPPGGPIALPALEQGGGAPSTATTPADSEAAAHRAAIGLALADSGLLQVNSSVSPEAALAAMVAQQQAQWSFGVGVRMNVAVKVSQSAPGPSAALSQDKVVGPETSSSQNADTLIPTDPLHRMGSLQGEGPLQGMGPLMPALPVQDIGPIPLPGALPQDAGTSADLMSAALNYQSPANLTPEQVTTLTSGNLAAMNELVAQLLASGQANPQAIQQIINVISSSYVPTSLPSSISQPTGPTGLNPSFTSTAPDQTNTIVAPLPPAVLPPTTYMSGS